MRPEAIRIRLCRNRRTAYGGASYQGDPALCRRLASPEPNSPRTADLGDVEGMRPLAANRPWISHLLEFCCFGRPRYTPATQHMRKRRDNGRDVWN